MVGVEENNSKRNNTSKRIPKIRITQKVEVKVVVEKIQSLRSSSFKKMKIFRHLNRKFNKCSKIKTKTKRDRFIDKLLIRKKR